ncbi:MAG: hypothetical protein IPG72_02080 [Ardenticatenales bacterium]|nr:hypothetical protein [Ardenticatenales bacterium]
MAWETRNGGGRYYTRSRKVDGRVVREYVGRGRIADLAAALDDLEREERAQAAAAWRAERETNDAERAAVRGLGAAVDDAVAAELAALGYHKERGEWRRAKSQG